MSDNRPLLSICIPTYNRIEYLRRTIESIIRQPEFRSGDVEMIISDNCSSDNTREVCERYAAQYDNIKYFCNEQNIIDRNFPLALNRGTGVLRKLCNDTLLFNEGTIYKLLKIIESEKEARPVIFTTNTNDAGNARVDSLELFLYNVSFYVTWIGGVCVWGDDVERFASFEGGCNERLWQVPFLLNYVNAKKTAFVCKEALFTSQVVVGKDISYGLYRVFYVNYLRFIKEYVDGGIVSQGCFDWLERDLLFNFFAGWMLTSKINRYQYSFSDSEDLAQYIEGAYREKAYYNDFCRHYRKRLLKARLKSLFRKILESFV